jgi:hypothetical protein
LPFFAPMSKTGVMVTENRPMIEPHDAEQAAARSDFSIRGFASRFDISTSQARRLVKLYGKHTGVLVREAWKLKK